MSELDHIVDSQDGYGSLGGELQTLYLGHGWFYDTVGQVVSHFTVGQVETGVFEGFLLLVAVSILLGGVVEDSEFGQELSGIFGSIQSKHFRDDLESLREFSDGQLFTGAQSSSKIIEIN